jgi:hypothetical protein
MSLVQRLTRRRYSEILDYHNVDAPPEGMDNGLAVPVAV